MTLENKEVIKDLNSKLENKYIELKRLKNLNEDTDSLMDEIWNLSKKKFVLSAMSKNSFKKYDGLIFTVGFSHEPIILNILVNNPTGVFFIYTKESEVTLNKIIDETGLKFIQCKREIMKKNSFENSIDLIGLGLLYLNKEKRIDISKIGLDITGGTKIMSVACGIAALALGPDGPDILYIDHEKFDIELRRPVPGTEVYKTIQNPLRITNKIFEDKGLDLNHTVI